MSVSPKGGASLLLFCRSRLRSYQTPSGRPYYWQIIASSKRIPIYIVSWFLIQLASYKMNKTKIFIFPIWKILTMKCMVQVCNQCGEFDFPQSCMVPIATWRYPTQVPNKHGSPLNCNVLPRVFNYTHTHTRISIFRGVFSTCTSKKIFSFFGNTCGWKSVWKYVWCCLNTENCCLSYDIKQALNIFRRQIRLSPLNNFFKIFKTVIYKKYFIASNTSPPSKSMVI